jgi:hypothetical protein
MSSGEDDDYNQLVNNLREFRINYTNVYSRVSRELSAERKRECETIINAIIEIERRCHELPEILREYGPTIFETAKDQIKLLMTQLVTENAVLTVQTDPEGQDSSSHPERQ